MTVMSEGIFNEKGLFFVPLGGSEQFGVNLNVYVSDGDMLAIDCGIGFADERFPGIDLLLPDPTFIADNKKNLKGFIITHAHEDHIGAMAHLWGRMPAPIYASPFTASILRKKLEEKGLRKVPVEVVEPGQTVQIGSYKVEFVAVSHSVPDACSLVIETPHGRVVHSGDWNLDPAPVIGEGTDDVRLKAAGEAGVLAYIGDSTNAEVDGYSGSEADVAKGLEAEFSRHDGRIAVTTFSSNVWRIVSIVRAAEACGRRVAVLGRSMHNMIGAARDLGLLKGLPDFVEEGDIQSVPDDELVVIMTGSQGEYRATLAKVARGDFRNFSLQSGDTVIFSARAIPGNETSINQVKNNLSAGGIAVITPRDTDNKIHVSGHPCRAEIAQMFQWLKPDLVVPVHGERMQLDAHAAFARECQVKNTLVPSNGSVIKLAPGKAAIIDHVEVDVLAVDPKRLIDANHNSIVERRKLQFSGTIHVSIVLDARGELLADPQFSTVGLIDIDNEEEQEIEHQIYDEILDAIEGLSWEDRQDDHVVAEQVRIGLRRFSNRVLGMKPNTSVHVARV
jgi:ribonuclease J